MEAHLNPNHADIEASITQRFQQQAESLLLLKSSDSFDDFLAKDEFYEPLDANRITRLAAANLREAVRLARAADDSAQAARDRQLSGGRV